MGNISRRLVRVERLIYFDCNSTAPYSPSVKEYLKEGILEDWQNPSAVYPQSQILNQKIKECRKVISEYLNCSPKHLFFTSGATESINTVLSSETLRLNQLSQFISSPLEHHATIKKLEFIYKYHNISTVWIPFNEQGEINLDSLEKYCAEKPHSLLSFLSANNETGVITDIPAISKIARKYRCLVHVDAVQSLGKMSFDLEKWDVDFVSFSGHKIGAMKGVGLLYAKKPFAPLMYGGSQERNLRAGTYNFPAIHSFKLAVQDIDLKKQDKVRELRDYLEEQLLGQTTGSGMETSYHIETQKATNQNQIEISENRFKINCKRANRLPNTSNIYCGGISNQVILLSLCKKGIGVSTGSACHAGSPEPSHVITYLVGLKEESHSQRDYASSCIRISLSPSNTKKEADFFIHSLKELVSPSDNRTLSPESEQHNFLSS